MHKRSLLLLSLCLLLVAPSVRADEDEYDHPDASKGVVGNYDLFNRGHQSADMYLLEADQARKMRQYDKAILLCQKALQIDPEDCDIHLEYANDLEAKLRRQPKDHKDPNLFLATVREWLLVARSERGDEKGLTNASGIGLPMIAARYVDEDRSIPAWQHITALVGFKPKQYETDAKFLKRVEKAVDRTVVGKVVSNNDPQQPAMTTHSQPSPAEVKRSHAAAVAGVKAEANAKDY